MQIVQSIQKFVRDEEGVTAIEYGLIAALISVFIIAGATLIGPQLNRIFMQIANALVGSAT